MPHLMLALLTLSAAPVDFDLQGYVDTALAGGARSITIPPGRYRVTPKRGRHLSLRNLTDVTLTATGVELICTETTQALELYRCGNVKLSGLTIDYDPLPYTEGRIVAQAPDKSWLEFEILDGYPDVKLETRIEIYDQRTDALKESTWHNWQPFEKTGERRYKVARAAGFRYNPARDRSEVGDFLVTNQSYAPHGNAGHAVVLVECTDVTLEDIDLFASNCFGFLEESCSASLYRRCRIDRRPLETDLVPRAHRRLRSLDADAFHSNGATVGPRYLGCVAKWMGDDAINIHGHYHFIAAATGPELRVLANGRWDLAVGEPVELFGYDGVRLPDAVVVKAERDGTITEDEHAFLAKQRMHEPFRTTWKPNAWRVTLDRGVELTRGALVASANHMGNGFAVRDCDFGYNRSRGILIKASRGVVSGNKLTGNWGPAILVSPEFWWLESGSSCNVEVRDNVITDCQTRALVVEAQGGAQVGRGTYAPAGAHREIAVTGNRFSGCPAPNVLVTSVLGGKIEGNVVERVSGGTGEVIKVVNCEQVVQGGNVVPGG